MPAPHTQSGLASWEACWKQISCKRSALVPFLVRRWVGVLWRWVEGVGPGTRGVLLSPTGQHHIPLWTERQRVLKLRASLRLEVRTLLKFLLVKNPFKPSKRRSTSPQSRRSYGLQFIMSLMRVDAIKVRGVSFSTTDLNTTMRVIPKA